MLALTPETLEAAYDFLCTTHPYKGWNMPAGEDVKFRVIRARDKYASYCWNGKQHEIGLSENCIGHTITLVEAMAHEMIHMHLEEHNIESRGSENVHNAAFRQYARQVCEHHGFDLRAFY